MTARLVAFAALLSVATAARADGTSFWTKGDTRRRDNLMAVGDRHLLDARQTAMALGGASAPTPTLVLDYLAEQARAALASYEKALEIGPETTELHYRAFTAARLLIGSHDGVLPSFKEGYEALIRHVDGVRRLSPLDPREDELSYEAGIAYSKLGALGGADADTAFEKGIREYEHFRAIDGSQLSGDTLASTYSNEAELIMAVGRLDESIRYYRIAIELNPLEPLSYFGLAVALDRNGEWSKAAEAMREADRHGKGIERFKDGSVFFVPNGDVHYYYALYHQVRGETQTAVTEYNRFLERCKDTKWAARARAHLAELGAGASASR